MADTVLSYRWKILFDHVIFEFSTNWWISCFMQSKTHTHTHTKCEADRILLTLISGEIKLSQQCRFNAWEKPVKSELQTEPVRLGNLDPHSSPPHIQWLCAVAHRSNRDLIKQRHYRGGDERRVLRWRKMETAKKQEDETCGKKMEGTEQQILKRGNIQISWTSTVVHSVVLSLHVQSDENAPGIIFLSDLIVVLSWIEAM